MSSAPKQILVVEDDAAIRRGIVDALEFEGYRTHQAANGKAGRDVATVEVPGGAVDLARREVAFDDGRRADLSEREADLLRYLAANAKRAVTRDELLAHVWRLDPRGVTTRTIDMQVARLREKLGATEEQPIIRTVRGKGYMFDT